MEGWELRCLVKLFHLVIGRRVGQAVVLELDLRPEESDLLLSGDWYVRVEYRSGRIAFDAPRFIRIRREELLEGGRS